MADLHKGELIGERYRLEHRIGQGGMASVWRARDETLYRPVAVKFLHSGYSAAPDSVGTREEATDGFLREARIAAAVRHRNVVAILDFGTHEDTTPFMVMEFLEGESLADRLERGERPSRREALRVAIRVLQGLAEVHAAGIVHRDMKPANIFLVRERAGFFPKLLDFGISRSVDQKSGRRSALTTKDGHIVGTLQYMSPEQARGLIDIDRRTDIYSMGVILFELLTGRLPFDSPYEGDLLVQIMTATPPTVLELAPEVGKPLSDAVSRAIQRGRDDRFQDAEEMQTALMQIAELSSAVRGGTLAMSVPPPPSGASRAVANGKGASGAAAAVGAGTAAESAANAAVARKPVGGTVQLWTPGQAGQPAAVSNEVALLPAVNAKEAASPDAAAFAPETMAISAQAEKRSWATWLAVAAAVLLLGVGAITVALAWPRAGENAAGPRYIVVKGGADSADKVAGRGTDEAASATTGPVAGKIAAGPAPGDDPSAVGTAAAEPAKPKKKASPSGRKTGSRSSARPKSGRGGESLGAALGRAFAGQKQGVQRCFQQHAAGQKRFPRLSVRLELGKDGSVASARVNPKEVAETGLGNCLRQACRAMKFEPQKEVVSFTIPLTARVGR